MIKADKYLKELLQDIKDNGGWDENPRPVWKDGTKAHSKYITQKTLEFDISKGEYPISTLRNGNLKSAFNELKTIYIDQSNKEEDFEKNGIHWWNSWMNEDGNLGTSYSYNLESGIDYNEVIEADKILIPEEFAYKLEPERIYELDYNNASGEYEDKYLIFEDTIKKEGKREIFQKIQYKKSGITTYLNKQIMGRWNSPDIFDRTTYNIGFIGDLRYLYNLTEYEKNVLKDKWENMFRRCYSEKYEHKGKYTHVYVHQEWHDLSNFLKSVFYIPNFFLARRDSFKGWDLDKDYFNSNMYSLQTCTFLPKKLNSQYNSKSKQFLVDEKRFITAEDCSEYLQTYSRKVKEIVEGKRKNPFNKDIKQVNNKIFRHPNSKNQVIELLKNLEKNKFSRRHIISFFNWKDQDKKELMECAFQNLFSVRSIDGVNYLDQTLTQRSSDFIVAGMINCSQYVMLNMIICNHLKYKTGEDWKPGKFVWFVQNLHIYDKHQWASEELIQREPTGLQPTMELNCQPKDFFQHTWEDFKVTGIEGIKPLNTKLEIAI